MAFLLTPRFASAYTSQQYNPWACAPRPQHSYRRIIRPSFPSFTPFLSGVDELISALDEEARREAARREAHSQRQQRQRIVQAHFSVHENPEGYQIDAELPFFQQEHIDIEITDDSTLKLSGNTDRKADQQSHAGEASPETQATVTEAQPEVADDVTLSEPERSASGAATPEHSDTESHRSYQATVEDDFEDLGAETASAYSAPSENEAPPREPKGKEKAAEKPSVVDADAAFQQPQAEAAAQQQSQPENQEAEWQFQGSFERTFRFPQRIDAANVAATLKNGLLSITVPKAKAPEVRKILIQ